MTSLKSSLALLSDWAALARHSSLAILLLVASVPYFFLWKLSGAFWIVVWYFLSQTDTGVTLSRNLSTTLRRFSVSVRKDSVEEHPVDEIDGATKTSTGPLDAPPSLSSSIASPAGAESVVFSSVTTASASESDVSEAKTEEWSEASKEGRKGGSR